MVGRNCTARCASTGERARRRVGRYIHTYIHSLDAGKRTGLGQKTVAGTRFDSYILINQALGALGSPSQPPQPKLE
eukprot:6139563-Prymnesium_polylepis.1